MRWAMISSCAAFAALWVWFLRERGRRGAASASDPLSELSGLTQTLREQTDELRQIAAGNEDSILSQWLLELLRASIEDVSLVPPIRMTCVGEDGSYFSALFAKGTEGFETELIGENVNAGGPQLPLKVIITDSAHRSVSAVIDVDGAAPRILG